MSLRHQVLLWVLEATECLSQTDRDRRVQTKFFLLVSSLPKQKPGALLLQLCRTRLGLREPMHFMSVHQPPFECRGSMSFKVMVNSLRSLAKSLIPYVSLCEL